MDYKELNNLTDLIDHIDSEMTRIYNKLLEFEHLIKEFEISKNDQLSTILIDRIRYMREYSLLSIDLAKLVEKKREILDLKVNVLTKKEERDNIGGKEWHDLKPEDRMLILEDWGFGDDIKWFKNNI